MVTSGITGLAIHPTPFQALRETYGSTLSQLQAMPPSAIYRQATEAVTNQRLSLIDACEAKATASNGEAVIAEFENEIEEAHCIEEVIDAAETELELVKKMSEWKACVVALRVLFQCLLQADFGDSHCLDGKLCKHLHHQVNGKASMFPVGLAFSRQPIRCSLLAAASTSMPEP